MTSLLGVLLLSLVTVSDQGRVFQPALSPDATRVAFARELDGAVSILVAPTDGGPPLEVAQLGRGCRARRLALLALSQSPWSPDSESLLLLKEVTEEQHTDVGLFTARWDGADLERVAEATGTVDAAVWSPEEGTRKILCTHRDPASSATTRLTALELGEQVKATEVTSFGGEYMSDVLELAPSPDGLRLALLLLEGPPEARERTLKIYDLERSKLEEVEACGLPNMLRFSGERFLFYVDTEASVLHCWDVEAGVDDGGRSAKDVRFALPLYDGDNAIVAASDGQLFALDFTIGERKALGSGYAAVSATPDKLALVRLGREGAAVVVVPLTAEKLILGELGIGAAVGE